VRVFPRGRPTYVFRMATDLQISFDAGPFNPNGEGAKRHRVAPEPRVTAFPPFEQRGEMTQLIRDALFPRHVAPPLDLAIGCQHAIQLVGELVINLTGADAAMARAGRPIPAAPVWLWLAPVWLLQAQAAPGAPWHDFSPARAGQAKSPWPASGL